MKYIIPNAVKKIPVVSKMKRNKKYIKSAIDRDTTLNYYGRVTTHLVEMIFDAYLLEYMTGMGFALPKRRLDDTTRALKQAYLHRLYRMLRTEANHILEFLTVERYKGRRNRGVRVHSALVGTWFKQRKATKTDIKEQKKRHSLYYNGWYNCKFNKFKPKNYIFTFQYKHYSKATAYDYMNMFYYGEWEDQYGGLPWARIAYFTHVLENTVTTQEIIQAIDHIHQLAHNTGSCMNKFSGLEMVYREVLDAKAHEDSLEIMEAAASNEVLNYLKLFRRRTRSKAKGYGLDDLWLRKGA